MYSIPACLLLSCRYNHPIVYKNHFSVVRLCPKQTSMIQNRRNDLVSAVSTPAPDPRVARAFPQALMIQGLKAQQGQSYELANGNVLPVIITCIVRLENCRQEAEIFRKSLLHSNNKKVSLYQPFSGESASSYSSHGFILNPCGAHGVYRDRGLLAPM